jgi:hypothetical protein
MVHPTLQVLEVNFLDIGFAPFLTFPYTYTTAQKTTNQFVLMYHLYQIFSSLLGCSLGSPTYQGDTLIHCLSLSFSLSLSLSLTLSLSISLSLGDTSMHNTHRFKALTNDQKRYFIQEVGNAALSYGITVTDATAIGTALT